MGLKLFFSMGCKGNQVTFQSNPRSLRDNRKPTSFTSNLSKLPSGSYRYTNFYIFSFSLICDIDFDICFQCLHNWVLRGGFDLSLQSYPAIALDLTYQHVWDQVPSPLQLYHFLGIQCPRMVFFSRCYLISRVAI